MNFSKNARCDSYDEIILIFLWMTLLKRFEWKKKPYTQFNGNK